MPETPALIRRLDGSYLAVGEHAPLEAARYDAPASEGETSVIVPAEVIDALTQPLRDRVTELQALLAAVGLLADVAQATTEPGSEPIVSHVKELLDAAWQRAGLDVPEDQSLTERDQARARAAELEEAHAYCDGALQLARNKIARLEVQRDQARQLARYAYSRWPAPIFWQAAAEIDNPYTALPDWLTADADDARSTGDCAAPDGGESA